MNDIQKPFTTIWQNLVDLIHWLNTPTTVQPVVEVGVWTTTAFFTLFFIIMCILKPRNKVDVGWTWLVGSVAVILWRVVTFQYTDLRPRPIWSLIIWSNIIAAVLYTSEVYITYKWRKYRLLKAARKASRNGG